MTRICSWKETWASCLPLVIPCQLHTLPSLGVPVCIEQDESRGLTTFLLCHLSQCPMVIVVIVFLNLSRPLAPRDTLSVNRLCIQPASRDLLCQPGATLLPPTMSNQVLSLHTCPCLPGSQSVSCVLLRQPIPKGIRDSFTFTHWT